MAWSLPRLLGRVGADLVHTQYALPWRCPCPAVVTIHDLSFERDSTLMGRRDRFVFRRVVPRAARRAARVLTVSERSKQRPRRALRARSRGDRRDAERRRPGVPAGRRAARATTCSRSGPSSHARTSSRRSRPRRRSGCRSSSSARRRTPASRGSCATSGATLRGYVEIDELAALYRGRRLPRAGIALRGLRPPRARGDGERDAGGDRAPRRRCSRSPAVLRSSSRTAGSPTGSGVRSPTARRSSPPASSARATFSWRAAAERTIAVYQEALGR